MGRGIPFSEWTIYCRHDAACCVSMRCLNARRQQVAAVAMRRPALSRHVGTVLRMLTKIAGLRPNPKAFGDENGKVAIPVRRAGLSTGSRPGTGILSVEIGPVVLSFELSVEVIRGLAKVAGRLSEESPRPTVN